MSKGSPNKNYFARRSGNSDALILQKFSEMGAVLVPSRVLKDGGSATVTVRPLSEFLAEYEAKKAQEEDQG